MENVERLALQTTFKLWFAFYLIPKVMFFYSLHYMPVYYRVYDEEGEIVSKTSCDRTDTSLVPSTHYLICHLTPSPPSSPVLFPLRKSAPITILDCSKKVARQSFMTMTQSPLSLIFIQVSIRLSPLHLSYCAA